MLKEIENKRGNDRGPRANAKTVATRAICAQMIARRLTARYLGGDRTSVNNGVSSCQAFRVSRFVFFCTRGDYSNAIVLSYIFKIST